MIDEQAPAGLRLEVAGRGMAGPPVAGAPRRGWNRYLLVVPAVAVLAAVLVVPIGITVWQAFATGGGLGFGNFAAAWSRAGAAVANSLLWLLIALGVVVVGFVIALLSQRVRRVWRPLLLVLVIPVGMSTMVVGVMFRLIFDPAPELGAVSALAAALHHVFGGSADSSWLPPPWLGPGLIWLVLISAFTVSWLGFAVSLFRTGLDGISPDVIRVAKVEGIGWLARLRTIILPTLRPVTAIVVLTLVLSAARLFDLVLVVVPQPVSGRMDVVATRWWQLTSAPGQAGPAAALAVLLYAFVAVVALVGMPGLRHRWVVPERPAEVRAPRPVRRWRRWALSALGVLIIVVWAFPELTTLATAFRDPVDAGLSGWWRPVAPSLESFVEAARAGLWGALLDTALLAVLATGLVLVLAVPAAYVLSWGGLPRWVARGLTVLLVVLAVTPVQMYAAPLGQVFSAVGQSGAQLPLAVVHAAAGLPFAVLLLRWKFTSVPANLVAGATPGEGGARAELDRVWRQARPAVVAVAVLEFVQVWNDFAIGFLVSGTGTNPLTLLLWGQARQFATSAGPVAASAAVSSLVPVVVLLANWRTVVRGLTGGALR
ncbi:MAG TPA: ABC transporter permease subunit [Pseudonocardiaceae bacterium]|jgi:alpha-glucoside transport system permease protein|nr:ABC transporter permease subunit [Pseudonocardiaceae bacterium]